MPCTMCVHILHNLAKEDEHWNSGPHWISATDIHWICQGRRIVRPFWQSGSNVPILLIESADSATDANGYISHPLRKQLKRPVYKSLQKFPAYGFIAFSQNFESETFEIQTLNQSDRRIFGAEVLQVYH